MNPAEQTAARGQEGHRHGVLGPLPQRKELLDRAVILNHCCQCKQTIRIYTVFRAGQASKDSMSVRAGIAEG